MRELQRAGRLMPGDCWSRSWWRHGVLVASLHSWVVADGLVQIQSRLGPDRGTEHRIEVDLEWAPCLFGGRRAWWRCPSCDRRVAILYDLARLACRHCHRLVYRSQREESEHRAIRRAEKLRAKLQWQPGIANPSGGKPKGMHWRTFDRLQLEHDRCVQRALACKIADADFRSLAHPSRADTPAPA